METNRKLISEAEFRRIEENRKADLSALITRSGLPYSGIAEATGTERRAVKRAADREGIRFDTAVRLEVFLLRYIRENETKH